MVKKEKRKLRFGDKIIEYIIVRSQRAKKVWLKVEDEEGLVVVLPKRKRISTVNEIIWENSKWIKRALERREERLKNSPPPLGQSKIVIYRGKKIDLKVKNIACKKPIIKLKNNTLSVLIPKDSQKSIKEVLLQWMKEKALLLFYRRVEFFASKLGVSYGSISVKNMKTRWGSCSSTKNLSFNLKLLLAPPEVLDYVVAHEVCHLKYPNHSEKFWKLLKKLLPSYQRNREWLRENALILKD